MQLQAGGRFALTFEQMQGQSAVYSAAFQTPDQSWTGHALVHCEQGEVEWLLAAAVATASDTAGSVPGGGAPGWLVAYARSALRSAWKQAPETGWPRRITRWREPSKARR